MEPFKIITPELQLRLLEIQGKTDPIHGWLMPEAGINLYRLARYLIPTGTIVELGSWKGRSTIWLANAVKDRKDGKVYAVDTWEGSGNYGASLQFLENYKENQLFEEFLGNMSKAGVAQHVVPLRGMTNEMSKKWPRELSIGLLYIDADHVYESVREDFYNWSQYVAEGGYIVFDDVPSWPGPSQVVTELPEGFEYFYMGWNHYIARKTSQTRTSISQVMQSLMSKDGRSFVEGLYREILNREPDEAGLSHHVAILQATGSKIGLAAALILSEEARLLYNR